MPLYTDCTRAAFFQRACVNNPSGRALWVEAAREKPGAAVGAEEMSDVFAEVKGGESVQQCLRRFVLVRKLSCGKAWKA